MSTKRKIIKMDSQKVKISELKKNEIKRAFTLKSIHNLSDQRFITYFRVSKEIYFYILARITPFMNTKNVSTSLEIKLLTTLSFYGSGYYRKQVTKVIPDQKKKKHTNLFGLKLSAITRFVEEITQTIEENLCSQWIIFPTNADEREKITRKFELNTRFPNLLGVVDSMFMGILWVHEIEKIYTDREQKLTLNVQLICDSNSRILSIDPRFPGSTDEYKIWALSHEKKAMQMQRLAGSKCYFFGDDKYPLEPWLITPFTKPKEGSNEEIFNLNHSSAFECMDELKTLLKTRFNCLSVESKIRFPSHIASKIINVCACLHNMCLAYKVNLPLNKHINNKSRDVSNTKSEKMKAQSTTLHNEGEIIRNTLMKNCLKLFKN